MGTLFLKPNLARHDFPPHTAVAEQAEPGIVEGGGLVMLKEEMSGPGACVALHQGHRD